MSARQFTFTVAPAPTYPWIPNVGEWGTIAKPEDGLNLNAAIPDNSQLLLASIYPSNTTFGPRRSRVLGAGGRSGYLAYSGGTSDDARKEYLLCANGGDGDSGGNECYVLRLQSDAPRWIRLNEPSRHTSRQSAYTGTLTDTGEFIDFPATTPGEPYGVLPLNYCYPRDPGNGQLRSRSMHTYGDQNYWNGKVWFANQGSMYEGPAGSRWLVSFNRNQYGEITDAYSTPPYGTGVDSANPWEFHFEVLTGSTDTNNGYSAIDPQTGIIWRCVQTTNIYTYISLDLKTTPPTRTAYTMNTGGAIGKNAFSIVCRDGPLGLWVVGLNGSPANVWIRDVDNPADTAGTVVAPPADEFNWDPNGVSFASAGHIPGGVDRMWTRVGMSAGYDSATKSILLVNPRLMGGQVRQLLIPTTSGRYDPSGLNSEGTVGWKWNTLAGNYGADNPANPLPMSDAPLPQGGIWNRARLVKDVGGADLIVMVCSVTGPTYVYRIR